MSHAQAESKINASVVTSFLSEYQAGRKQESEVEGFIAAVVAAGTQNAFTTLFKQSDCRSKFQQMVEDGAFFTPTDDSLLVALCKNADLKYDHLKLAFREVEAKSKPSLLDWAVNTVSKLAAGPWEEVTAGESLLCLAFRHQNMHFAQLAVENGCRLSARRYVDARVSEGYMHDLLRVMRIVADYPPQLQQSALRLIAEWLKLEPGGSAVFVNEARCTVNIGAVRLGEVILNKSFELFLEDTDACTLWMMNQLSKLGYEANAKEKALYQPLLIRVEEAQQLQAQRISDQATIQSLRSELKETKPKLAMRRAERDTALETLFHIYMQFVGLKVKAPGEESDVLLEQLEQPYKALLSEQKLTSTELLSQWEQHAQQFARQATDEQRPIVKEEKRRRENWKATKTK